MGLSVYKRGYKLSLALNNETREKKPQGNEQVFYRGCYILIAGDLRVAGAVSEMGIG